MLPAEAPRALTTFCVIRTRQHHLTATCEERIRFTSASSAAGLFLQTHLISPSPLCFLTQLLSQQTTTPVIGWPSCEGGAPRSPSLSTAGCTCWLPWPSSLSGAERRGAPSGNPSADFARVFASERSTPPPADVAGEEPSCIIGATGSCACRAAPSSTDPPGGTGARWSGGARAAPPQP